MNWFIQLTLQGVNLTRTAAMKAVETRMTHEYRLMNCNSTFGSSIFTCASIIAHQAFQCVCVLFKTSSVELN